MIELITKLDRKINRLNKKGSGSEGYSNNDFPLIKDDRYPALSFDISPFWSKTWHKERAIEYYRMNDLWLSNQIFTSVTLSKKLGKIFFDFEYYSYIESISIIIDNPIENDVVNILINDINIMKLPSKDLLNIDFNHILMLNEYMTIYLESESLALVQIKYRLVG